MKDLLQGRNVLPIGSVVLLKNGSKPLMILGRATIFLKEGVKMFSDYSSCLYPNGVYSNDFLFFSDEDIEQVMFFGFENDTEKDFQKHYLDRISKVNLPKFVVADNSLKESSNKNV